MKDEDSDKGALIDYRLQRARETLGDAHLLCDRKGSLWSVINRAYYAMFYAVLALLTSVGKGASKHSGVLTLFDEHFIKPGHLPREMSKAIHKAFELRQIGDYRELATLDEEQATEVLTMADEFVYKVGQFLERGKGR
jgi:uncharacterized protein (UPF0332 family)